MAGSHRAWAEGFVRSSEHDVRLVSLPGERWRWRLRGGAVELVEPIESCLEDGWEPDVLLVSGLVDVAVLLGLTRPRLGNCAVAVYQHESQMLYPTPTGTVDIDAVMHNINSWLVADVVLFNSEFHRHEVEAALGEFAPTLSSPSLAALLGGLSNRFEVLSVGVDLGWVEAVSRRPTSPRSRPQILWPHRWDADKRPDVFLRALQRLAGTGLEFSLVLAGDLGGAVGVRDEIVAHLGESVVAVGPFETEQYRTHLLTSDLVVSCADHEFFGIAVVEALAGGCFGVLPDRLSYPEIVGGVGSVMLYDPGRFGSALEDAIRARVWASYRPAAMTTELVDRFSWQRLGPRYDDRLRDLAAIAG